MPKNLLIEKFRPPKFCPIRYNEKSQTPFEGIIYPSKLTIRDSALGVDASEGLSEMFGLFTPHSSEFTAPFQDEQKGLRVGPLPVATPQLVFGTHKFVVSFVFHRFELNFSIDARKVTIPVGKDFLGIIVDFLKFVIRTILGITLYSKLSIIP